MWRTFQLLIELAGLYTPHCTNQDRRVRAGCNMPRAGWTVKRRAGRHDRRGAFVGQTFLSVRFRIWILLYQAEQEGMPVLLIVREIWDELVVLVLVLHSPNRRHFRYPRVSLSG